MPPMPPVGLNDVMPLLGGAEGLKEVTAVLEVAGPLGPTVGPKLVCMLPAPPPNCVAGFGMKLVCPAAPPCGAGLGLKLVCPAGPACDGTVSGLKLTCPDTLPCIG